MLRILSLASSRPCRSRCSTLAAGIGSPVQVQVQLDCQQQGYAHQSCCRRMFDSDANQRTFEEYRQSLGPARRKFFDILNRYRSDNYSQCLPSRFLKDVINAVDANSDGIITMEEYQKLLQNIGAQDEMSTEELGEIFDEIGVDEDGGGGGGGGKKVILVSTLMEKWKPLLKTIPPRS